MSSNQNKDATRRVTSIRRKLASQRTWKKIGIYFSESVFLIFVMLFVWFAAKEKTICNNITFEGRKHYINLEEQKYDGNLPEYFVNCYKNIRYVVVDTVTDTILIDETIYGMLNLFAIVSGLLFIFKFICAFLAHPSESNRIKKVLSPINDIAIKLEELSKLDFSEDKYQLIEDKISHLEPNDDKPIKLGDEDLLGIENAINSLINRIRESNKQQARFVNDASHELRTPIAVIEGYANLLGRWGREDEKVLDESIVAIQNESAHMKHLVEQLLFLARGDAGRTAVNKEKINICELMNEVYEESLMIDENHIYKYSCPDEDIYINADEGLIKQAVRILVDNAGKYTAAKDEIVLKVGMEENESNHVKSAFLQVQDTGIGMKEADIEHMFERFYRADEARSFGGTGLGLSIAKWIVDKHEGYFEITSREDLGTRIKIVLPSEM